ncbi:10484_t:CDS:2, partial [Funneliformis caledonium]
LPYFLRWRDYGKVFADYKTTYLHALLDRKGCYITEMLYISGFNESIKDIEDINTLNFWSQSGPFRYAWR